MLKSYDESLTVLARNLDIAPSTLHGWLNGLEPKSIVQLKKVADYFGTSLEYLCFNQEHTRNINSELIFRGDFTLSHNKYEITLNKINPKDQ